MYYKIVSKNISLINKASNVFASLDMNESIHIQEVDFWLVDINTLDNSSLQSYKNKITHSFVLFIVNSDEQIQICLENGFTYYVKNNFSNDELISWCKLFFSKQKSTFIKLDDNTTLDFNSYEYSDKNKTVSLTLQEMALLKAVYKKEYVSTVNLMNILKITSQSGVRSIINRIRKKTKPEIFVHKRHYGYKLNIKNLNEAKTDNNLQIKELEEQNHLMQEIIDSSPIFIVTFVHKQLYCINKSFREYLGSEIVEELWLESKGDFFQLIKHNYKQKESLKQQLFTTGIHKVELLNFKNDITTNFKIKTYYFENLDKHLLIFEGI